MEKKAFVTVVSYSLDKKINVNTIGYSDIEQAKEDAKKWANCGLFISIDVYEVKHIETTK